MPDWMIGAAVGPHLLVGFLIATELAMRNRWDLGTQDHAALYTLTWIGWPLLPAVLLVRAYVRWRRRVWQRRRRRRIGTPGQPSPAEMGQALGRMNHALRLALAEFDRGFRVGMTRPPSTLRGTRTDQAKTKAGRE